MLESNKTSSITPAHIYTVTVTDDVHSLRRHRLGAAEMVVICVRLYYINLRLSAGVTNVCWIVAL